MNEFEPDDLRPAGAVGSRHAAPTAHARRTDGRETEALAFNEVSLLRETRQAAKIRIVIDDITRLPELAQTGSCCPPRRGAPPTTCRPTGRSSPSALTSSLTPVSPTPPLAGALLRSDAVVRFEVLEQQKRPVSAVADDTEARDVTDVEVNEDRNQPVTMLYDPERGLEERILQEQFEL